MFSAVSGMDLAKRDGRGRVAGARQDGIDDRRTESGSCGEWAVVIGGGGLLAKQRRGCFVDYGAGAVAPVGEVWVRINQAERKTLTGVEVEEGDLTQRRKG